MIGENENTASRAGRLRFWSYRRIWSAITLVVVLIAFVGDSKPFLETVRQVDYAIADAIKGVTPIVLIDGFNARAQECNYRWLVYCAATPSKLDCLRSGEPCFVGPGHDLSNQAIFWRTIQTLAQLPDTTWYMLKKAWHDGYVPLGLLIVFIVINVAVTARVPVIVWPISLPVTTAIASGLFWLVQQAFLLGTETFGVLLQLLLASYVVPPVIVAAYGSIRKVNELHEIARKSTELMGRTPNIQG
jgi:hypothetical protein